MKTTLIVLAIITIPSLIVYFHNKALKWLPYRWFINSILSPIHCRSLKRMLYILPYTKKLDMWHIFNEKWFAKYWFGKKLLRIIENDIDKKHNGLR